MSRQTLSRLANVVRRWLASGIFARGAVSFLFATAGVNVASFLFHVVISRLLGPSHYGEVGSILSVLSVLTVPLGAAQLAVTQAVMGDSDAEIPSLRRVTRHAFVGGLVAIVIFAALIPIFDNFLHVNSPVPLLLIALWIPLATVGAVLQGALIGEYRFRTVAFATFFGGGPIRLLVGALLVEVGLGVDGAILATVIAQIFTTGTLILAARQQLTMGNSARSLRTRTRDMSLSITALGCYTALIGVDTFLSRHFFSAHAAGIYAAGAVAAHIALFVPGALVTVVFPHLVDGQGVGKQTRKIFVHALELTLVVGVVVATALTLLSHVVIGLLFGSRYDGASQIVGRLAFASAAIGAISLFVFLHLARRAWSALTPFVGLILAVVFISAHHPNLVSVSDTILLVSVVTLLLTAIPGVRSFAIASAIERSRPTTPFTHLDPSIDVTFVVPFYNPGSRLKHHVEEVIAVLTESKVSFEVLAVSDGSTDQSEMTLREIPPDHFSLVRLEENQGKGSALRAGLIQGRGRYLGFIDGDGDIPAHVIRRMLDVLDREQPDVIYGSKRHKDSDVVYPPLRRAYSWTYQQLNRILFRLPLRDTQTGIKIVRREVLQDVLPRMVEKRFAFDLELFVVAQNRGFSNFVEVPVEIQQRFSSTISTRSIRHLLQDTLGIAYRSKILGYYNREIEIGTSSLDSNVHSDTAEKKTITSDRTLPDNQSRFRILVLNWRDLAHPRAGGAEIYTHEVTQVWAQEGHSVTLFCAAVEDAPPDEIVDGVRILRRGTRLSVYREARRFYESEGQGNFDLVLDEINTRPFFANKWVNDAQVIALIHQVCRELWRYQLLWPLSWFGRYWLEPHWLRAYKHVLTMTLTEPNKLTLERAGLKRVVVVPEGHSYLSKTPDRRPEMTPTVLFVGRLEPHKRPQDAIRAFELFQQQSPDAQLWIIGSGSMDSQLRRMSSRNVRFLGRVTDQEKFDRMSRAHVLVVTSVREGWGLVVTEAAEVGLPSIAYDVPGLRESVQASGGVLAEPNPDALALAIIDHFKRLSENGPWDVKPGGVIPWVEVAKRILDQFVLDYTKG